MSLAAVDDGEREDLRQDEEPDDSDEEVKRVPDAENQFDMELS